MSHTKTNIDGLFERRITYPDFAPRERLAALVGLDGHKERLTKILALLVNPVGLETWAKKHHPKMNGLLNMITRRPPLVVLARDVGSGKTELAEAIGDAVARQEGIDITLFPLSLSARGQGRVGEMTQLISAAFDYTVGEANKLKTVICLRLIFLRACECVCPSVSHGDLERLVPRAVPGRPAF